METVEEHRRSRTSLAILTLINHDVHFLNKLNFRREHREALGIARDATGLSDGTKWRRFFAALDKDGSSAAYRFRCIRCGALGGYHRIVTENKRSSACSPCPVPA